MNKKPVLKRICSNKEGLTLLEAVVAISIIAIVSVGVTAMVFSLSKISKMSEEQLKANAVIRVVKENVVNSVRNPGVEVYGTTNIKVSDLTSPGNKHEGVPIIDVSDQEYPYKFDLLYHSITNGIRKYIITIRYEAGGEVLTEFAIEVYTG
jgi:type II secretory pathway pseudopilin PulG